MISSVQPPGPQSRRRVRAALVTATLAASLTVPAALNAQALAAVQLCGTTATSLNNSRFEIDLSANLVVNGGAGCIDWLTGGTGTEFRPGVLPKYDKPSGSGDDSFGQGTAENNPNPTIVTGSIPPGKDDLKAFGVFTETTTTPKFLELFWTRVQSPQGTATVDFELNQKFCDTSALPTNCAMNGPTETATPVRTPGDKLITYDLSGNQTKVVSISIREWNAAGTAWGPSTTISGGANPLALGSINTIAIPQNQAGGPPPPPATNDGLGPLDPFTFGEAAISYTALFPNGGGCRSFGSAYAKSRASNSFNAEVKDFIAPERVQITNCTSLITQVTETPVTVGDPISDTATLGGATDDATGTITFHLFNEQGCPADSEIETDLVPVTVDGPGDYFSGEVTPTEVGTYYWTAEYVSGDNNNANSATACGDSGETVVIDKRQPTIATLLDRDTINVGESTFDTATLSGGSMAPVALPSGTVTYTVYSNNTCTAGARDAGTKNVTNGVVDPSDSLTFDTLGTFYWQASYSGDANNEAAISACTSEPLVVTTAASRISTTQSFFPNDSATVSSDFGTPTGTVKFRLYNNATCTGTPIHDSGDVPLVNGSASTNNTTDRVSTTGTYRWLVEYSGDASHDPVTSECGTENTALTVNNG
ncbi:hypothetical protein [Streptomyces sp. NPDC091371]|uniref:hypothetical protein n=1 Tax=Streptomyces sp. NPDC091371 TaxID=3155303 RepID=UPI00342460C3